MAGHVHPRRDDHDRYGVPSRGGHDLGQAANVVALSLTEGIDKPLKSPLMFRNADLVVLTKLDLLPISLESRSRRSPMRSRG